MDEGRGIRVDSGVCRHFGGRRDGKLSNGSGFWDRVRALFFSTWGQGEPRDKDSISSKWTDINNKCHAFQEVFQRNYDNRPSGEGDVGVLTKSLEEFERTKGPFTYYKCWELLRKSPKWAVVNPMTSSSRRQAKRSKTSSSVDPSTPTSDARNVDLNEAVDEGIQEELARPAGRRKGAGKKSLESSSDLELKDDFEEMNRRLQDIRDLGHQRYEIMKERMAETKKFNEMQEARQMEKDIEFLSKPILERFERESCTQITVSLKWYKNVMIPKEACKHSENRQNDIEICEPSNYFGIHERRPPHETKFHDHGKRRNLILEEIEDPCTTTSHEDHCTVVDHDDYGSIPYPPKDIGGCNDRTLDLKCICALIRL
ncbi:uncharacterized protein LOC118490450 [Helianthus annuus]|uniref:uncharacterized protein LOC118490450 n=1 Tax=Helianthus annuus TaxID=4232 RepID=UPI0016530494|nr:uncharacterized protein LOC118490450 [Helianthus annuus]